MSKKNSVPLVSKTRSNLQISIILSIDVTTFTSKEAQVKILCSDVRGGLEGVNDIVNSGYVHR